MPPFLHSRKADAPGRNGCVYYVPVVIGRRTLVVLLASGCTQSGAGAGEARDPPAEPVRADVMSPPPAARDPTTLPEPPSPPPTRPGGRPVLIVGTDEGLLGLDDRGNRVRQYTMTRATAPRLLDGGRSVLFWAPDSAQLRLVSVEGKRRRALAEIPTPPGCPVQAPLDVWEDDDFAVDESAGIACLRLRDREELSDLDIVARVRLDTGEVTSVIESAAGCPHDEHPEDLFTCKPAPRKATTDGRAVSKKLLPRGFRDESSSPGGPWSVISGNVSEGDFVGRDLLLLNEDTGEIFPIVEGPWPAPVPREKVEAFEYETQSASGASTVEWQADGKRLLADWMLVFPGERSVYLDGWLAR